MIADPLVGCWHGVSHSRFWSLPEAESDEDLEPDLPTWYSMLRQAALAGFSVADLQ